MSVPKVRLETLLKEVDRLPPMPEVVVRALDLIDDPRCKISELSKVLNLDHALMLRALRWANSSLYGLRYQVTTVDQAIMTLGLKTIRELVVAASVDELLNQQVIGYSLERGELWRHSVTVAAGSRYIAQQRKFENPNQAFVAGMLHDIGKLAFDRLLQSDRRYMTDWNAMREQGMSFIEMERALTGHDHARIGGVIAGKWKLPDPLCNAIEFHARPGAITKDIDLVSFVYLADVAAHQAGIGVSSNSSDDSLDDAILTRLNWTPADMEALIQHEVGAIEEAEAMFHKVPA